MLGRLEFDGSETIIEAGDGIFLQGGRNLLA